MRAYEAIDHEEPVPDVCLGLTCHGQALFPHSRAGRITQDAAAGRRAAALRAAGLRAAGLRAVGFAAGRVVVDARLAMLRTVQRRTTCHTRHTGQTRRRGG